MVQPPCQCPSWWVVVALGAKTVPKAAPTLPLRRNSDVSIFAQAPPPLTNRSDLSHTVKPRRPRKVPRQRSFVEETQNGLPGRMKVPTPSGSFAWPSLLVVDQSTSKPKTHQPT